MWHPFIVLAMAIGLGLLVLQWRRRARFLERLRGSACALCRNSFDDAIAEYLGRVGPAERQRLDAFQRRFAVHKVRCGDCDAINICTADGTAFRAWIERE